MRLTSAVFLTLFFSFLLIARPLLQGRKSSSTNVLRWSEGESGCTFSADDDGKYRYGLWTDDFGIILAVDAQELQKALQRVRPLFAVFLTVRYRGQSSLALNPDRAGLEYVKHEHDWEPALAPDDLSATLQADLDALARETEREVRKHPDHSSRQETAFQETQQTIRQTQDFVRARSLRSATLDATHAEVSGWLFFNARSKWIGDWKKQEELILRMNVGERVVEFPFALPPSQGDFLLRRRPEQ